MKFEIGIGRSSGCTKKWKPSPFNGHMLANHPSRRAKDSLAGSAVTLAPARAEGIGKICEEVTLLGGSLDLCGMLQLSVWPYESVTHSFIVSAWK